MTDSNNSGNNPPDPTLVVPVSGTITATQRQPGQVLSTNGWVTIPVNTGGTCAGNYWIPGTVVITTGGGGGGGGQLSFDDKDLAVPVESKEKSDGCFCKKCKEYYQYAEPNQEDKTLICYSCRTSW